MSFRFSHANVPPDERVAFLLNQRADLRDWAAIPLYAGFATAPLYDHLPGIQQAGIIIALIAGTALWQRFFRRWIERRVGVFRERPALPKRPKHAFLREAKIWGAVLVLTALIIYVRRDAPHYPPHGWMERTVGIWLVGAVIVCLRRFAEKTNLPQRRLWNGVAAAVLMFGWSFEATSPVSYAALLVLLGSVYLALALLDLILLLNLAATARSRDGQEAHA